MTIVIKEIQVKTTIGRTDKSSEPTVELFQKLKRDWQRETINFIKSQNKRRKER
ncbi:MAG: hypothetical protein LBG15_14890 [Dysgonamonadaceae bacterium]|jgi:hypothetical protein|nr:hypothetical protein [Dysgonamonadaceae bacterium]